MRGYKWNATYEAVQSDRQTANPNEVYIYTNMIFDKVNDYAMN